MIKKILIVLSITFFLFSILEIYSYILTKRENELFYNEVSRGQNSKFEFKTEYKLFEPFTTTYYRPSTIVENTDKMPIIWFGCSFAEGAGLDDNNTPCNKISNLTNRSCINKAKSATGPQYMYYQLKQNNFKVENPNADFVIYTFTWNHLQRLHNYQVNPLMYMHNLRYELKKNDELKEINPKFNPIYLSYFVKRILNKQVFQKGVKESNSYLLFNKIMIESYNLSKKYYPNAKFIILEFPEAIDFRYKDVISDNFFQDWEIKNLESFGITVVKVTDLLPKHVNIKERQYWLEDGMHPKAEVWDMILPKLKEKYLD